MKITSTEEYGLRILIRIAKSEGRELAIAQIADQEGITHANVAKICRLLRIGGLIDSVKGHAGGYRLIKEPANITLSTVLGSLGEPLYGTNYSEKFAFDKNNCDEASNDSTTSVRSVWKVIQHNINHVLARITLADLVVSEEQTELVCSSLINTH